MKLTTQKLERRRYRMVEFHDPNCNRFCMIHPDPCDGQTDGRAIAYSALSICYAVAR